MVEQRYHALVERVNDLLTLARSLARTEVARPDAGRTPDLDQLKNEAARLAADIDAIRHDLGATNERPRRPRPTGLAVRENSAVPGYWFG